MLFSLAVTVTIIGGVNQPALGQPRGEAWRSPHGCYCEGGRWGWYGAPRRVKDIEEAEAAIRSFYAGRDIRLGEIRERPAYFETEIRDQNQKPVDRIIVDKRTGRIRSIH